MKRIKMFQRKSKGEIALHLFVSFIFLIVATSYLVLVLWPVMSAFKTHTTIVMEPFALPKTWNWRNFIDVFSILNVNGKGFLEMLFNSIYFSVGGVLIGQFVTMSFAYCCTMYEFPGSKLPFTIILITMTLPLYGSGGALYEIIYNLGLVNSYAHIILAIGGMNTNFLFYRACFQNTSRAYIEAAQMDGAGEFQTWFKVMMPMAKPIFGALFLIGWLGDWNNYSSALIYLPQIPTLPVGIYQFSTEMIYRARLDILFAACTLTALPAVILYIFFNKTITTSVSFGGLKG